MRALIGQRLGEAAILRLVRPPVQNYGCNCAGLCIERLKNVQRLAQVADLVSEPPELVVQLAVRLAGGADDQDERCGRRQSRTAVLRKIVLSYGVIAGCRLLECHLVHQCLFCGKKTFVKHAVPHPPPVTQRRQSTQPARISAIPTPKIAAFDPEIGNLFGKSVHSTASIQLRFILSFYTHRSNARGSARGHGVPM